MSLIKIEELVLKISQENQIILERIEDIQSQISELNKNLQLEYVAAKIIKEVRGAREEVPLQIPLFPKEGKFSFPNKEESKSILALKDKE